MDSLKLEMRFSAQSLVYHLPSHNTLLQAGTRNLGAWVADRDGEASPWLAQKPEPCALLAVLYFLPVPPLKKEEAIGNEQKPGVPSASIDVILSHCMLGQEGALANQLDLMFRSLQWVVF